MNVPRDNWVGLFIKTNYSISDIYFIYQQDVTQPTSRLANEYSTQSLRDPMCVPLISADITLPMSRQGAPGEMNNLLVLNQRNLTLSTDGSR